MIDRHVNSKKLDQDSSFLAGTQIATVQGGVDSCGSIDYPSLYIRLDDPEIFSFISANTKNNGETFSCPLWQLGFLLKDCVSISFKRPIQKAFP